MLIIILLASLRFLFRTLFLLYAYNFLTNEINKITLELFECYKTSIARINYENNFFILVIVSKEIKEWKCKCIIRLTKRSRVLFYRFVAFFDMLPIDRFRDNLNTTTQFYLIKNLISILFFEKFWLEIS